MEPRARRLTGTVAKAKSARGLASIKASESLAAIKADRLEKGYGTPLDEAAQKMLRGVGEPLKQNANFNVVFRSRFVDLISIASKKDSSLAPIAEQWGHLPVSARSSYTIDDLASFCGIEPTKLISAASGVAYELGFGTASLIAMSNLPRVIEASLDSAEIPGKEGAKDRELLMRHGRFVPVPEGQTINIQNIANAKSGGQLESFEESMKRFGTPAVDVECIPTK